MVIFLIFATLSNSAIKKHFICTLSSNGRASKVQKNEPSLTSMRQMVLEISHFRVTQEFEQDGCRHFVDFLASLSLKYDVRDAILQDIEKMKVKYLMSLLFDLFEILQAVRSEQTKFT